ncbi:MAG: hypothetical protein LBJ13_01740 [Puniceicoccales bacterium]|jgi:hypothetical protein|nr:hypothetical protein [Puniceicoccales bacterium]
MNKLKILSLGFGCFISAISYTNASTSSTRSIQWNPDEDELLVTFVRKIGERWNIIADAMPGRNQRQCRERWNNFVRPFEPSAWNEEEDNQLIEYARRFGNNWRKIASYFPGRSDINCKNRWNAINKKESPSLFQSFLNETEDFFNGVYNWAFEGNPSELLENANAFPNILGTLQMELASRGLKVDWNPQSAFNENLCGYAALLAAQKIDQVMNFGGEEGTIIVNYSEVCAFAEELERNLADLGIYINAPLGVNHLKAIAQYLGICIILEIGTPYESIGRFTKGINCDAVNAPKVVRMFLFVDQAQGHYQIITPLNITINYENDALGTDRCLNPFLRNSREQEQLSFLFE